MTRILVLNGGASVKPSHAGATLHVPDPVALFEKRGINAGDILVYDAIIKQLRFTALNAVSFGDAGNRALWPKEAPDATIIRGSNYLTARFDLTAALPLVQQLRGPIVAMGVGAQASTYCPLEIPKGSIAFWREVADKCVSIGVRGAYSAEIFHSMGIRNLRIIGCPSFYRSLLPELSIRKADPGAARLGLTLNRHLSGVYTSSRQKVVRLQRALVAAAARRPGSHVFSQGEREESLMPLVDPLRQADLLAEILRSLDLMQDSAAARLFSDAMSAHLDVDAWAEDVRERADFVIGFRLHGTAIALQQGIPGIYFTYDSRIREMASLYRVPSIEIEDFPPVELERIMAGADFTGFEQAYRENYAEYHRFLEENGLPHRLPAPVAAGRAGQAATESVRLPLAFTDAERAAWYSGEWNALSTAYEILVAQLDERYIRRGRM